MRNFKEFSTHLLTFLRKPGFLAFLYFTLLSIVMTFPLILNMDKIYGGPGGDGTYFVWLVDWYRKALFELHISPFFDPYLNYPAGWNLASTDLAPVMVALAMPVSLLFGPLPGYNFSMLLTFIISGWGMYLWVKSLTNDFRVGLIAGTIYAFLPFHMAHYLIGHFNNSGMQWFPFYFWGLHDLLRQEKFSLRPVFMAGIAAGLIGGTTPYYIYMTILLSVVFLAGYLLFGGLKRLQQPVFWKSLGLFVLLGGLLVGITMLPYLSFNAEAGLASRSVEFVSEYSASPTDFVIPPIHHFLWGQWIDDRFSPEYWQEATLYIGAVAFLLGLYAWLKRKESAHRALVNIALLTATAAFILALGIDLHWLGRKVNSLPTFLQPLLGRESMPQIYLPAYYLFLYLPFFSKMRVMMRFGLFVLVCTSLMAGLGSDALIKRIPARLRNWVALGLLLLVCVEFHPGLRADQFSTLDARPVDYWLAEQPDSGAIALFPFWQQREQVQVYNTMVSGKPYIGGFFNANFPEQYLAIEPVLEHFPSTESAALLANLGVAYVVVDSSQYDKYTEVDEKIASLGLVLLHVSEGQFVYGLP